MYISKLLKNNKILLCLIFFILLFISGCEVSQNPCVNHIDNNNDMYCDICNKTKCEVLGHNFSTEWTVDKEPTYTEVGQESRHCLNCDEITDIKEIQMLIDYSKYFTFELNSDEQSYTLTRVTDKNIKEAIIPSTYESLPVTSIGDSVFEFCNSLKRIEIPNSVTSIGYGAFFGCSSLTSIKIPDSVTNIGDYAFQFCSSLTYNQYDNAYYLGNNDNLYYVLVKAINTSIETCNVNEETRIILYSAFRNCSNLTSIEIPNSVTSIGYGAFKFCNSLKRIEIPNSVTSIGDYAFSGCSSLTNIEIPNSVTSIGKDAFYYCSSLTSIIVDENNPVYDSRDNSNAIIEISTNTLIAGCQKTIIPNSVTSIGYLAFHGCTSLTSIYIPNSVTSIGDYAFWNCSSLTSIEIPNSVTSIGRDAFSYCSSLTSIEIPDSVTSIGRDAFSYCSSLTSIYISNSVTSIGYGTFLGCSSLTSIYIPNSVTSIDSFTFLGCSSLTSIVVDENNPVYDSRDNSNAIIETSTNTLILGCQNTTIPNSVTSIGVSAFSGCSSLTSIEIPNSVTSIGSWAFFGCISLTSIEIPNSVTSIGSYAFSECSSLTIYCEVSMRPSGWYIDWNRDHRPVYWGTSKD